MPLSIDQKKYVIEKLIVKRHFLKDSASCVSLSHVFIVYFVLNMRNAFEDKDVDRNRDQKPSEWQKQVSGVVEYFDGLNFEVFFAENKERQKAGANEEMKTRKRPRKKLQRIPGHTPDKEQQSKQDREC